MKAIVIILLIILILIVLAVVFPIIGGRSPGGRTTGATLFKSEDGGETWKNLEKFPGGEVRNLKFDVGNPELLLIGTERRGLWKGKKDGEDFEQYPESLGEGSKIFDLLERASAENLKALVFWQKRGRVIWTVKGERRELLFASLDDFAFLKGEARGDLIRVIGSDGGFYESSTSGKTWKTLSRFRDGLLLLEVNPANLAEIWVVDGQGGLHRSADGGRSWENLTSTLRDFSGSQDARVLLYEPRTGILYHASSHGLLESLNQGKSWREVPLPVPPEALPVSALAIDPKNSSKLFAAAQNQLYLSPDRGLSWKALRIQSGGRISAILIDPKEPKNIFIGLKAAERLR